MWKTSQTASKNSSAGLTKVLTKVLTKRVECSCQTIPLLQSLSSGSLRTKDHNLRKTYNTLARMALDYLAATAIPAFFGLRALMTCQFLRTLLSCCTEHPHVHRRAGGSRTERTARMTRTKAATAPKMSTTTTRRTCLAKPSLLKSWTTMKTRRRLSWPKTEGTEGTGRIRIWRRCRTNARTQDSTVRGRKTQQTKLTHLRRLSRVLNFKRWQSEACNLTSLSALSGCLSALVLLEKTQSTCETFGRLPCRRLTSI
mmetsp:Transcript_8201/g.12372  ORF Transcript_8201/g.12372 Transcript_8201/m.12372 type:complete len:256 (-) Transcript_8201:44-811(-)